MNQFGERVKQLREQMNLLQREIAHQLNMDTPMLSKIERGERRAKKEQVAIFASIFSVKENELLSLWLADQVYEIVKDEGVALRAIQVAEEEVKYQSKRRAK
jgi:transcriptional regulator with XRE-family HTH domain